MCYSNLFSFCLQVMCRDCDRRAETKVTRRGPNINVDFRPDLYASTRDFRSGKIGIKLVRAEANTFRVKAERHDMPFAGYHSVGVQGPNARANAGVSTDGFDGSLELSAGKITGDVGRVRGELNPNLTTSAKFGRNGFETRVAGTGASLTRRGVAFHTSIGSIGWRF